jgi:hypothetical protein
MTDQTRGEYAPVPYGYDQERGVARHDGQHGLRLTAAEAFWYVLGNVALGAMYFAKIPVKKALEEAGLATMTAVEKFWYVLMCVALGAGYFAKVPVKRALSESKIIN